MKQALRSLCTSVIPKLRSAPATASSTSRVSSIAIRDLLQVHKIAYKDGHASFLVRCPFCDQGSADKQKTIFVNKTTGSAICDSCNLNVSWSDFRDSVRQRKSGKKANKPLIRRQQQLQTLSNEGRNNRQLLKKFLSEKASLWDGSSDIEQKVVRVSQLKKLDPSVIRKYSVYTTNTKFPQPSGGSKQLPCVVFPWYSGLSGGDSPVRLKIRTVDSQEQQQLLHYEPTEGVSGLFGWNTVPQNSKEVVITADEFDAVAVHQATSLPAVALPQGTSSLPPEVLPQLERFERIYLWMGTDAQSRQSVAKFAKKLDETRCYIIGPTDERDQFTSALDALNEDLNIKDIVARAKPVCHKQIITFKQLREEVYAELSDAVRVAGVKWRRYPYLTQHLKGHRQGELTIITGRTGSGKTTLMSELSLDLCQQGVSTLWGSFEIRNTRLAKTMIKQFSGVNLEKHPDQFEYWANRFQQLPLYFMGFYGAVDITTVIETMSHAAYVHDIQHVVIDNLQFMIGTRNFDDSFSAQNKVVAEFRKFASDKNVHVTVVMHPRKEDDDRPLSNSSIFGTAKASQEADNVLILQTLSTKEKALQITKNRFAGDLGKMSLHFNKDSLTFSNIFGQGQGKPVKHKAVDYKTSATSENTGSKLTVKGQPRKNANSSLTRNKDLSPNVVHLKPDSSPKCSVGISPLKHSPQPTSPQSPHSGLPSNRAMKDSSAKPHPSLSSFQSPMNKTPLKSVVDNNEVETMELMSAKHRPQAKKITGLSPVCADYLNRAE